MASREQRLQHAELSRAKARVSEALGEDGTGLIETRGRSVHSRQRKRTRPKNRGRFYASRMPLLRLGGAVAHSPGDRRLRVDEIALPFARQLEGRLPNEQRL